MAFNARRSLAIKSRGRDAESSDVIADSQQSKHVTLDQQFHCAIASFTSKFPRRRQSRLPFASIWSGKGRPGSRKQAASQGANDTRRKPKRGRQRPDEVFMIASASEGAASSGIPAWRVALGNIAAGATAGATVEAALYPIDTIKTRLQASISGGGIRALLRGGGGNALYAGVWGNLAGVMPASAIFMGIYEPVKQHIARKVPENRTYLAALGGGALAGFAASFVRVPTEVVKQRLQTGEFKGAVQAVSSITRAEGMKGLFAGYGSFLLRDLPFDAIEFVAYEQLKHSYKASLTETRDPNSLETSAIGAVAGAFTGVVTTPLDVIKTRLMTQGSARTYSGVLDCAQKIWQLEGPSAFLKGWQPRIIWIGLGGCVFFTALEEAKKLYIPKEALTEGSQH